MLFAAQLFFVTFVSRYVRVRCSVLLCCVVQLPLPLADTTCLGDEYVHANVNHISLSGVFFFISPCLRESLSDKL